MRSWISVMTVVTVLALGAALLAQEEAPAGAGDEAKAAEYVAALNSRYLVERREARKALEAMGEAAVEPLVEALKSEQPGMRSSAAIVLGRMKVKLAVPELIRLAQDPALAVRNKAAEALAMVGEEAVDILQVELKEARGGRKEFIEKMLGRVLLGAVREFVSEMMVTPKIYLYVPGPVERLKQLGPGVLKALEQLSDWDVHRELSYYALNTFGDLGDTSVREFLKKKHDEALAAKPGEMVYRAAAAMALAKLGEPSHAHTLISEILNGEYMSTEDGRNSSAGATYLEMGLADKALKHYGEAKKLNPGQMAYTFRLGCAHALKGDAAKAVSHLKEAVEKGFVKASLLPKIRYFKKIRQSKGWKDFISEALKKEKEKASKENKDGKEALKK